MINCGITLTFDPERELEDHEQVVEVYSSWPREHTNVFLFKQNDKKYDLFEDPIVSSLSSCLYPLYVPLSPAEILSSAPQDISCRHFQGDDVREGREGEEDIAARVFLIHFSCPRAGGLAQPQGWLQKELEEGFLYPASLRSLLLHKGKTEGWHLEILVWLYAVKPTVGSQVSAAAGAV